jgi:phosphoglycolate phosphatase
VSGSAPARVSAVLFDLDGTLLDTAPDMAGALNALLAEGARPSLAFAAVRPHVSNGAAALVRLAFPDVDEARFEALRVRFLQLYRERIDHETALFPGGDELLAAIEARRLPWGVVTNKPAWLTEPLLAALALDQRAGTIVSGDTLPERKPHPRPLLHAADVLGVAAHECLYVGDALRDVEAARSAGMRALVAGFGYLGPDEDARAWPAEGWLERPLDLLRWLDA